MELLKIVVLGDGGVGKTAIVNALAERQFEPEYRPTIGAEFITRSSELAGRRLTLQVWDSASQERFQSMGLAFCRGADGCVLAFDLTQPSSLARLEHWKEEFIYAGCPDDPDTFPFVVIGNKADAPDRRVSEAEAKDWCGQIPYYETSAKSGQGVEPALEAICRLALRLPLEPAAQPAAAVPTAPKPAATTAKMGACRALHAALSAKGKDACRPAIQASLDQDIARVAKECAP